jgi:hypothetical protein
MMLLKSRRLPVGATSDVKQVIRKTIWALTAFANCRSQSEPSTLMSPAKCTRAAAFIEDRRRMPIQLRIIVPAETSIDLEEGA